MTEGEVRTMSVLFAVRTSSAGLLRCELRRLEGQVRLGGAGTPVRGAGSFSQEEVLLRRFPADAELRTRSLAPREESPGLLYAAGRQVPRMDVDVDAQPFRFQQWLFAHAGAGQGPGAARTPLLESLPETLQRLARGQTDHELLFLHFLAQLRERARADDRPVSALDAALALHAALERLEHALGGRDAGCAVATNGEVLVGARAGGQALLYTVLEGSERCEECGLVGGEPETDPVVRSHRLRRTVVLATDVARPAGWLELPPRTAVAVDADLQVQHVPAPARTSS